MTTADDDGDHVVNIEVLHVRSAYSHAHAKHLSAMSSEEPAHLELIRHRIIARVLELGVVAHSVIIGVPLGTRESAKTIKPLLAALCFHQFFKDIGLGSCVLQAKFESQSMAIVTIFFSLTAAVGVAIGTGISAVRVRTVSTDQMALTIQGMFSSASALVDLLAADFTSPRMQSNLKLQIRAQFCLAFGAAWMSLLVRWA